MRDIPLKFQDLRTFQLHGLGIGSHRFCLNNQGQCFGQITLSNVRICKMKKWSNTLKICRLICKKSLTTSQ
jgi:hypothetical protein